MEEQINDLLAKAQKSYLTSKAEYGEMWLLSEKESIKAWLRGYNANEHNNKLFNACIEELSRISS